MIVGYNHNVTYRGTIFHVQTEDSGRQRPQLVTLLYHAGIIISSKKTLYADIVKVDNLDQVVEELAKEQHKGMLRSLTRGEFDQRIVELGISLAEAAPAVPAQEGSARLATAAAATTPAGKPAPPQQEVFSPGPDRSASTRSAAPPSLDQLILSYLTAGRKRS
jgi:hypothetical protein